MNAIIKSTKQNYDFLISNNFKTEYNYAEDRSYLIIIDYELFQIGKEDFENSSHYKDFKFYDNFNFLEVKSCI